MAPTNHQSAELPARTAVVAHELNNILTIVRTYAHFARQHTGGEQTALDLRAIAAAAERATALADWLDLRAESQPSAPDEASSDSFVSSLVDRLQDVLAPGIVIEARHGAKDLPFRANALRLEHVMVSLVLAASQGFARASFVLTAEARNLSEGQHPTLASGPYTALVIACQGGDTALPPGEQTSASHQVEQLLAPLGDLMQTMNAGVEAVDGVDGGCRFELLLPALEQLRPPPASPRSAGRSLKRRTVCVVEDEGAIRLAVTRALTRAGHFVLEARDARSARTLLSEHGHAVHLLIADVSLPRAGDDFLGWAKTACPQAALLFVSGRELEGASEAKRLGARFLGKPFTPRELMVVVRDALLDAPQEQGASLAPAHRFCVLIVDDEETILRSYQRLLTECDFDTVVAKSALHALRILEERRVDAVVTDQFMPGLDGIGLLELVSARFPHCVRVLCTAHPASDIVISAINRGRVHRVLPKSMHAVALRDEIERAVLEGLRLQ